MRRGHIIYYIHHGSFTQTRSPHPFTIATTNSPPLPAGEHPPPAFDTPSHRTDKPWTEVVKGAAATTHTPDSYVSDNPYNHLRLDDDDNSSQRSRDLLTPDADDTTRPRATISEGTTIDSRKPQTTTEGPSGTSHDLLTLNTAAPPLSISQLYAITQENIISTQANTVGITKLETYLTTLTNHVQQMSSTLASLADSRDTAERAFNQATAATITLTGQGVRLDALTDAVSTLKDDLRTPRDPVHPSPDLHELIQSALDPLASSLSTTVTASVNLATATAEETIRISFE